MRASFLVAALVAALAIALAACTPEITPGTYLCGEEELCPEGQTCDGVSNTCELPSAARPFECGDEIDEVEPNDAFQSAQLVEGLQCVSRVAEVHGCSRKDGSAEDWFGFAVPSCTTVRATARIAFPLSYEPLVLELRDANDAVVATGEVCASDDKHDGDTELCIDMRVNPNDQYAIRVAGEGVADCDGACAYNRYTLTFQLVSP
ncbi:MAG: hypothetical protein AB7T06_05590 [Kofleriaceae bacterium]